MNQTNTEMATGESHFFINLPNYRIEMVLADNAPNLVVTFEPMGRRKTLGVNRQGWGVSFLQKLGCSVMAVMIKDCDWYRQPDLKAFFLQMRSRGFFHSFGQVMTYGGSMGGYAALAYADMLNATIALSLNPQATLSTQDAAWETRFSFGKAQNWQDDSISAILGFQNVKQAYVVYDPLLALDVKHVQLLAAKNPHLIKLKIPVVGHLMPKWMAEMGVLKPLVTDILAGQFSERQFYQESRRRRLIERYWKMLLTQPRVCKSARFTEIARRYAQQYGFPYATD